MTPPGSSTGFRYQRIGRAQKWRTGAYEPAVVPDLRAWLETRLGALAGFEVAQPAEKAPPEPVAPPAPFLPPRLVHVSNPAARTSAPASTLGRWLELVGRPVAVAVREGAPFTPAAAFA